MGRRSQKIRDKKPFRRALTVALGSVFAVLLISAVGLFVRKKKKK